MYEDLESSRSDDWCRDVVVFWWRIYSGRWKSAHLLLRCGESLRLQRLAEGGAHDERGASTNAERSQRTR